MKVRHWQWLTRLRELHLRNNRLTTLPEAVGSLAQLRQVDLRGNPIASLPESLLKRPRLEKRDLRWITTLNPPSWVAELEARDCAVYL